MCRKGDKKVDESQAFPQVIHKNVNNMHLWKQFRKTESKFSASLFFNRQAAFWQRIGEKNES